MTLVKICGITNLEDARHAVDSGADELGFNFYERSSRRTSPKDARKIVDSLPISGGNVGVFVNKEVEQVLEIAAFVGLDGIQLHGDETQAYVTDLRKRTKLFVIKAFRVSSQFSVSDAMDWDISCPLFDTYSPNERGGTGRTFDWNEFATDVFLCFPGNAYLAGGLSPDNVSEAIRIVRPYAVDVASGVESSPGKKDPKKVTAFIKAAKEAI
ncbi:MAG: phosphoribosylanthranilate isomerase [Acidobacteriota bacterium]